jgi:hypothetical protein
VSSRLDGREARRRQRVRAVRRRRAVALALLVGAPMTVAGVALARSGDNGGSSSSASAVASECRSIEVAPPAWLDRRRATVLVDSVLLGGIPAVRSNLRGWRVEVLGRPAVTVRRLEEKIRETDARIRPLAIVGVGYNSLWERRRRNHARWAREFDRHAFTLVRTLRRQGAKQIVWVTLRDARRGVVPASAHWQYDRYAWYFPYVNERLRVLDARSRTVVLADWAAVSDRRGITYDAIHLDPDGQRLMARTIRSALEGEAARQAAVERARAAAACKAGGG